MFRWLKRTAVVGAVVLVGISSFVAGMGKRIVVEGTTVSRGPLRATIEGEGTTRLRERRTVLAPVTGTLDRITLREGDTVGKDLKVARIAPTQSPLMDSRMREELKARVAAARAAEAESNAAVALAELALEHANRELERGKRLQANEAISPNHVEELEFAARRQAAELEAARNALQAAKYNTAAVVASAAAYGNHRGSNEPVVDVLSPIKGKVLRVLAKDAGPVQVGTPLVEIGDVDSLEVVVEVLTTDAVKVRSGMKAEIKDFGTHQVLAGSVRLVEPQAFQKESALGIHEQRVKVIVDLTDPHQQHPLGDAFHVVVKIVTWESENVLCVPTTVLFSDAGRWYAFAISDGAARKVGVTVGHRGEHQTEIVEGLAEGATVARYPDDRLSEGARVQVEERI